ncbi:MAG: MaoC family dehydratase [Proteobacteria bacterium]|nr:MaoC family dehydratase [Pseudomonadota bacterium]
MKNNEFLYLEDLQIGQRFCAGPVLVTAEDIIAFAKQFDPQDFHIDPIKARDTAFGELVASGWHTGSLTMRLIEEATPKMKGGMIGRSIEKMGWPRPVRPGDRLSVEVEILEFRALDSRPERGTMRTKNTTFNQHREPVLEMEAVAFVPRRLK